MGSQAKYWYAVEDLFLCTDFNCQLLTSNRELPSFSLAMAMGEARVDLEGFTTSSNDVSVHLNVCQTDSASPAFTIRFIVPSS